MLHTTATWISLKNQLMALDEKRIEEGLIGLTHALKNIVPMYVMCDPKDVFVVPQVKASHNDKPTIFIYDRYPGGVGLSEGIYSKINDILLETKNTIQSCPCESGCPSCIGTDILTKTGKSDALLLLDYFIEDV
jgi:DEAD/DEAH box helicase domain-containing protein